MSSSLPFRGRPVYLNVYDLIEKNDILYGAGIGILHSGVVVDGIEYSYGDIGGIGASLPKDVPDVKFRETIFMGNTFLDPDQVKDVIQNLTDIFTGDNYDMLNHNCNHFSNELCKVIVGKEIPAYINRCAHVAGWFSGISNHVINFVQKLNIQPPTNEPRSNKTKPICSNKASSKDTSPD